MIPGDPTDPLFYGRRRDLLLLGFRTGAEFYREKRRHHGRSTRVSSRRYRYIKAVFQYSGGVAAEPGYESSGRVLPSLYRSPMHSMRSRCTLERWAADQRFRSLRAALACAVHRAGFLRFQQSLRYNPGALGHLQGRRPAGKPGRAHQRVSHVRQARRAGAVLSRIPCR